MAARPSLQRRRQQEDPGAEDAVDAEAEAVDQRELARMTSHEPTLPVPRRARVLCRVGLLGALLAGGCAKACGMQDRQRSLWRVHTPERFPPRRRSALSPFFYANSQKMRSTDGPATPAANPRESLPNFPSRPSVASRRFCWRKFACSIREAPDINGFSICVARKRILANVSSSSVRRLYVLAGGVARPDPALPGVPFSAKTITGMRSQSLADSLQTLELARRKAECGSGGV